ncbi:MAG: NUDIX hydrolase [Deltaproteobacteria bacterium]|nr:NUDIX hydrolase [Deltaproteobacteria bacterium]
MSNKQTVFRTEWFTIEEEFFSHIESLNGKPYYRINAPDGVIVLAVTEKNKIILVRQFRPALNQYTLELPCGSIDPTESSQEAAVRELYEETGYLCHEWSCLGPGRIMMNRNNSREFAFFGRGAARAAGFSGKEDIEVILVSPGDFKALVLSGRFEQLAALAVLVLTDWKLGMRLLA